MQKKAVCILLAMVMLFSGFSAFAASENNPIFSPIENTDTAEIKSQARLDLEKQTGEIFKESDSVELIIGLKTEYFKEFGRGFEAEELRDSSNMETQIEFAKRATESALDQIRDAKIDFELFDVLDVILVGFTGRASYGDALKIAELPFIESVGVSVEYREPDFSEMDSRMPNSSKIVGQDRVKGEYDGSGMVVAILDSGVDSQHKAFYLTEKGRTNKKITVSNQDELDQLKNSLSIQDGKYYSEKIPFAYNYYDRNDVIKDTNADTGMHGQHVAGTAAGNTVQLSNGESFTGIAPEAQLLIMRVFGERIATTNSGVYVKAMNEAVKLGADSLNMSLGSPAGQLSSVDGGTIKAIETASKIGCIVAIAAGNEGQSGYGAIGFPTPSPNCPSFPAAMATIQPILDAVSIALMVPLPTKDNCPAGEPKLILMLSAPNFTASFIAFT